MSADKKRNIAKLQTKYVLQQEESQLNVARRKKFFLRRLLVFLVLVAVVSYLMISTLISQNSVVADKKVEVERLEKELSSLKYNEILLKEEIVKLNDDDYIAKLARKEYFLSEDNEIIFTLPEKKQQEMKKSTN